MARLVGPGRLLVHGAATPEARLCVTLTPTRGELVRVSVEDLRVEVGSDARHGGLFPRPYRAQGLVEHVRVARLADELRAVLAGAAVPAALTDSRFVLQATLPLADGGVEVELREEEDAPPLPLALALIEDFALQVLGLPETRVERLGGAATPAGRGRALVWRALVVVALVGAGGYLVGDFLQRALGCAAP